MLPQVESQVFWSSAQVYFMWIKISSLCGLYNLSRVQRSRYSLVLSEGYLDPGAAGFTCVCLFKLDVEAGWSFLWMQASVMTPLILNAPQREVPPCNFEVLQEGKPDLNMF